MTICRQVLSHRLGAVLLAFFFAALATAAPAVPPVGPVAPEFGVYAALLEHLYGKRPDVQLLIIAARTGCDLPGLRTQAEREKMLQKALARLPGADPQTLRDLVAKNHQDYPLARQFQVSKKYLLMSRDEFGRLGVQKLRETHPDSQGFLVLSRVGFAPSGAQALVYFTNKVFSKGTGRPEAWGRLVLLTKKDGRWLVKKEVILWCT